MSDLNDTQNKTAWRNRKPITRSIGQFFFLDLLLDKKARPVFIYVAVMIATGTIFYHWVEGWDYLDSLYFVVVTLTTIGYGDLAPSTPLSKWVTIFYGLNGVAILLMLFDEIRRVRSHRREQV